MRPHQVTDEHSDISHLFELLTDRPAWWAKAACRDAPLEVTWFPDSARAGDQAKAICATCPARQDCLAWSLEQGLDLHGIFGGLDKQDRARLKREKRAA